MASAQTAYDHVKSSYDAVIAARAQILGRIDQQLITIAIVFAALSYGCSLLLSIPEPRRWEIVLGCLLGGISAVSLSIAFCAGLRLSRIEEVNVPATAMLAQQVGARVFSGWDQEAVLAALTKNIQQAIEQALSSGKRREVWCATLNHSLSIGFVCAACFIAFVLALQASRWSANDIASAQLHRVESGTSQSEGIMNENSSSPKDESTPAQTPQSPASAPNEPGDPGPESLIEPPIVVRGTGDHRPTVKDD
jgi:hypothetical protein